MSIPGVTALLPMKGHSERVPGKNIRPLCDRPLCHWILEALAASPYVSEILVDTDSREIADLVQARKKVRVIMRPEHLLGDMVGINPLIENGIRHCAGEWFLQTHSTNPLLTTGTINGAIEAFFAAQNANDTLFSVTPYQVRFYRSDASAINHEPGNMLRTQDLPPIFEENSNLYLFSRKSFASCGHRIGKKPLLFPMNKLEAVDIDNEEDFILAELLMARRLKPSGNSWDLPGSR